MKTIVYTTPNNRARTLCDAMATGIKACGDQVNVKHSTNYTGPIADCAVFYGLRYGLKQIMEEYIAAGKQTVFLDLGYFGRNHGGKLKGYHRFAINGLHPNNDQLDYIGKENRFTRFGIKLKPYEDRSGKAILVAGMSEKAAWVYGLKPEEWEREMVARWLALDRKVIYRPKPSWKGATRIQGAEFSLGEESLEKVFEHTSLILAHHSNVAIDGFINGITSSVATGVMKRFNLINIPDSERLRFLTALSYCQWDVHEMKTGRAWKFLRENFLK